MTEATEKVLKTVRKLHSRQGRRKSNLYLCEGIRCCQEAIEQVPDQIEFGIVTNLSLFEKSDDFPVYQTSEDVFNKLALTESPQGILLVIKKPEQSVPSFKGDFQVVLDGVGDPGNLGTILRTCASAGVEEVILTSGTVDPYNPKSVRAGMGAQFRLKISWVSDLSELSDICDGRRVWLTTPHGGVSCYEEAFDPQNSLIVMGGEANGLADFDNGEKVYIPMPGEFESLNVGVAGSIIVFESVRRLKFSHM